MLEGSMMVARALVLLLLLGSLGDLGTEAQNTLDKREVDILKKAASKLNVTFWNFDVDPCSDTGAGQWFVNTSDNLFMRQVTCGNCNSSTNVCHIVSIRLKSQNLSGILPEDFASLTSLTEIDLTWNYLGGSIPSAWGSLSLVRLSLLGNRLTGEIPEEIGNIKNLGFLILENNLFQGRVPRALGKLSNLTRLLLSANNFTGVLPEELGKLKSLEDFRIDGNAITGNIPDFIGNWTRLKRLDMQGTALEGPFPNSFSVLENLTELRVTDFKGNGFFPPLQRNMKLLYLILRNCSISGQIPDFIRNMSNLNRLDLSFNNFTGEIPSSLEKISKNLNYLFLTNNNLSGPIPKWILESKQNVDISYNSFNGSAPSTCRHGFVNSVASFPSSENNLKPSCLRKNLPCSKKPMNYELFINCGGKSVTVDDKYYEGNNGGSGQTATYFFTANDERWAFSSTGYFVGNNKAPYVTGNLSTLHMINPAPYYMSARLSPMSLKYYGLCLQKGIYNVSLYFAEIMLTDDQTFSSVGRRIFDVSIQGNKVLEDFNIVEAANGTGIGIVKSFDIAVDDGTVEIHFQWLGKGTNAIPYRGMYGPLISAISVTPNFPPDLSEESKPSTGAIFKPSTGAIIGIVIGCFLFVLVILLAVLFYLRKKNKEKIELDGLDLHTGLFSLREIKSATEDFDPKNKIGEGGFGPVYKGVLRDGSSIAVKKLSAKSKQGNREFVNEIGMITALHHPNLVKLYGCCIEGKQLFLVYEYLENNSLARALFGMKLNLDWQTRCKICIGIARGLAYLHEESALKIVHRDIKATNILLDKDLNAKISDFGLAKLDEDENTHISTRIAGTLGYMSPEYAMRGYLTDKADVYSFGVVVLELVSGKSNSNYKTLDDFVYLLDWAYVLQEKGNLLELVDPCLGSNYSKKEVQEMLDLALLCTCPSPSLRPKMSTVVGMLQGQITMTAPPTSNNNDSAISDVVSPKAFQTLSKDCQVMGISTDAPCSKTSVNATSSEEENVLLGN